MKWQDLPGWYDFEITYQDIVSRYPGGLLVEVGNYLGKSLCSLGQMVRDSRKPFHIIGVDCCLGSGVENGKDHHIEAVQEGGGSFASQLHRNVIDCGLSEYITLIITKSSTAASLFADNSLTMVWLDARHDYESVQEDIRSWFPKVRVGGLIGGDDMGIEGESPVWPGVYQAVSELLPGFEYKPHDAWWKIKV